MRVLTGRASLTAHALHFAALHHHSGPRAYLVPYGIWGSRVWTGAMQRNLSWWHVWNSTHRADQSMYCWFTSLGLSQHVILPWWAWLILYMWAGQVEMERSLQIIISRKTHSKLPFVWSWIEGFQGVLVAHQNAYQHDMTDLSRTKSRKLEVSSLLQCVVTPSF